VVPEIEFAMPQSLPETDSITVAIGCVPLPLLTVAIPRKACSRERKNKQCDYREHFP
jgi:hypothetical protein